MSAEHRDYRELLLGCGRSRVKRIATPDATGKPSYEWRGLVTLDNNPRVGPDLLCDLDTVDENGHWGDFDGVPLRGNLFDEVHAYEVLEHLGRQGDMGQFFSDFDELWRILKPNGLLCATVPSRFSEALWGDPGHRRAIVPMSLVFLDQEQYARQCDSEHPTSMSDYRDIYKADFSLVDQYDDRTTFRFILKAVKPSRCASAVK